MNEADAKASIPDEFDEGMPGFLRDHYRIRDTICKVRVRASDGARRHFGRGLPLRLAMIESSLVELRSSIGRTTKPLSHRKSVELTMLLNAYYLNVCGSLDNLAWALTYELALLPAVDEGNFHVRRFCALVGLPFLEALREREAALAADLEKSAEWYAEVRRFRDPAAHRMPLHVPRSIFDEKDFARHEEIDREATAMMQAGDYEKGAEHLYSQQKIGTHLPVFIVEAPSVEIYHARKRLASDHMAWLAAVLPVVKWFGVRLAEPRHG